MSVKATRKKQSIPTYVPKEAIKLPMFFEHKPYQGASGRLYPLPFSDSISDDKKDVDYDIITLENEYIKTQVAPELGGKILRGLDKVGDYDFIYYNEVVKPALVGLAGPWISGGIEFNWPQHHRPTTYMPLESYVEENKDGSKTVWTGEVDPFYRMKGMAGITVDPGRSYIKAKIKVYNRTEQKQIFMWWANLAVPVNETYRTIFPPDVEWVNDHDRRCIMSWPIAKGINHSARPFDFGDGTDISMYEAIKVPSSFLVSQGQSDMDFVAGYDGGKQKGIATVANHHISPGKKMWHWGMGDFGDMWCSNLTDENGPYIELMTGVFTDNQPDFTWIAPYETKEFEQYWYPIRDICDVKNASIDAAVNVEVRGENLFFGFNVTGTFKNATVVVKNKGNIVFEEKGDFTPDKSYLKEISMNGMNIEDITVALIAEDGKVLIAYETYIRGQKQPIEPRMPVLRPCEIETVEELYINGLHLEQYKQHNYNSCDYYLEGIKRDSGDIRCNTAMARYSFKNGQFDECIAYADVAIERLTSRNQHPADVEAFYLKGIALKYMNKLDDAYDTLYRAVWDYSYRSAALFALAEIDCVKGRFSDALRNLDESISLNNGHTRAMNLKSAIYRALGENEKSIEVANQVLELDKLNMLARVELSMHQDNKAEICDMFDSKPENFIDVAVAYVNAGFYQDAISALEISQKEYPLYNYYKAYCYTMLGDRDNAAKAIETAENMDEGYCFPSRIDDIAVLENAIKLCNKAARANYYLGCLFYDRFGYDKAIALWEEAIGINPEYAKAYRNLALAYFDKKQDFLGAKICMEKALEFLPTEPRLIMEYQQLLKNMDYSPSKRLEMYEKYNDLMMKRDDCYLDKITLKCLVGKYEEAINMAKNRRFHIYEGGEGKLTKQHAWMHVLYGNELAANGDYAKAEEIYKNGINMPKSYGEAKTFFNQEAHIFYYLGQLLEKQGKDATECYKEAAIYKAAVSEISLFRALALRKLNKFDEARKVLEEMLVTAENSITNCDRRTYYGVGSPSPLPFEDDIIKNNLLSGYTLKAYALLGLGKFNEAEKYINKAKEIQKYEFPIYAFDEIKESVMELN